VHSVKDLAAEDHPGLCLASILKREDARDVFIANQFKQFSELPLNAVVGTASPRRQCQILAARPDLQIKLLRGNVETRVAKLRQGEYDAIILAAAGLKRLDMAAEITDYFAPDKIIPAIGQGAIGIECRADDAVIKSLVQTINDHSTQLCVQAERAVNVFLGGDCFTPIAAHATQKDRQLFVTALVGTLDGSRIFVSKISGPDDKAYELGIQAGRDLENQGARAFLS
jgi:hydroxymethylbilane synthase